MDRDHHSAYDDVVTELCERTLVTLIGDIGPWGQRLYLVGGLAPRYIVGALPHGVPAHIGTADVDLVIGLAIDDSAPETYATLQANLAKSGFEPGEHSFQWSRSVEGVSVKVEFLCETDQVDPGTIFRPRQGTGSKIGAFNAPGAQLVTRDFTEHTIEAERLDDGGISRVTIRVAGVLSYTVLKILAFQDRHDNKDAYDLIFTLSNYPGGPTAAGEAAGNAGTLDALQVTSALGHLTERFETTDHDGPIAYAAFFGGDNPDRGARLRNQAVAVVAQFLESVGFP